MHKDGGHVVTPTEALKYRSIFIKEAESKAPLVRFHRSVEDLSEKLSDSLVEKAFPGTLTKDTDQLEKDAFIKSKEFEDFYAIHRSNKLKSKSLNKIEENTSDSSE